MFVDGFVQPVAAWGNGRLVIRVVRAVRVIRVVRVVRGVRGVRGG